MQRDETQAYFADGKKSEQVNTMSNYEAIAQRAYELWEIAGKPEGKETEHWLQAEAEVNRQQSHRGRKIGTSPEAMEVRRGKRVFAL